MNPSRTPVELDRFRDLLLARGAKRILHVASGDGRFLDRVARMGAEGVGIEPDPERARASAARDQQVHRGRVVELLERSELGVFDAIFCDRHLERLAPPILSRTLHAMVARTAPGGTALIVVGNPRALGELLRPRGPEELDDRVYGPEVLTHFLQEAGYRDIAHRELGDRWTDPEPLEAAEAGPDFYEAPPERGFRRQLVAQLRGSPAVQRLRAHLGLNAVDHDLRALKARVARLSAFDDFLKEALFRPREVYLVARRP